MVFSRVTGIMLGDGGEDEDFANTACLQAVITGTYSPKPPHHSSLLGSPPVAALPLLPWPWGPGGKPSDGFQSCPAQWWHWKVSSSHLCRFPSNFLWLPLFFQLYWCLTENRKYPDLPPDRVSRVGAVGIKAPLQIPPRRIRFSAQPSFFPAAQGSLSWKGPRLRPRQHSARWFIPSQGSDPRDIGGIARSGVPFSRSALEGAQAASSGAGICSVGNPTQGGKPFCSCSLHFLTTSK